MSWLSICLDTLRYMRVADQDLEEFKRLYAEEFGEELSQAEASKACNNLAAFLFIFQPLSSKQEKSSTPQEREGDISFAISLTT